MTSALIILLFLVCIGCGQAEPHCQTIVPDSGETYQECVTPDGLVTKNEPGSNSLEYYPE